MRAAEMRDIIISKLKDGPKTTPELVEMTGFSPEQIRERMRRAKVEGMVESAVIDKEFMWYDKKQWDHVVQVKEDKGPITFGELRRIGHYIRPNFRIRVYDCVPKKGRRNNWRDPDEAHRQDLSPCCHVQGRRKYHACEVGAVFSGWQQE